MAAKFLHSLTDENPDLQKQIGCMTGVFQLFDRQHILSGGGRRVVGHGPKKLPHEQGGRGDNNLCIISDRHKAIEKACKDLWPGVGRRYCTKHLSVNFKKIFPGPKMWQLFWLAAGAYSEFTFEKAMKQIDKHKPGARLWLANLGEQERWSKHKFNTNLKSDVNKTNFVESFNATLGIDRTRPVLTLLEGIRRVTMVRMATRRELCEKWDRQDICPNIVKRVQVLCSDSKTCLAYLSGPGEYEIVDGKSTLPVSLNHHTCKCNQWQLTGVPCKHGMRAILYSNLDPLKFVHEWYSVKRYKMAYDSGIRPIPDREQWSATEMPSIEPPLMKKGVGRPVKNRRRGEEEQRKGKRSTTLKCSNCGEFGHNCLTCQGGKTKKQVKAKNKGKQEKFSLSHKKIQEKQIISTESSRASFSSSSRSSSFSSIDCNQPTQLEPASYDRTIFPETPSRDPAMSLHDSSSQISRQSLDIRDLVKDSMYREVHGYSIKPKPPDEADDLVMKYRDRPRPESEATADIKESLKFLHKLQKASWYQNEPRELLRSASYHAKEGSSFSVSTDTPPFSYDGREVNRAPFDPRDVSKSTLKLKDVPRLSLDSNIFLKSIQKDSTFEFDGKVQKLQQTPHQTRPRSIVAKLMGLETLPDSLSSSNDEDFVNIPRSSAKVGRNSIQTSSSSRKEPSSPRWRNSDSSMKPMSRFPIEPAPWKQIDSLKSSQKQTCRVMRAQAKALAPFPSVYSEIEKRLKDLEFTQSGKDLRALKQIIKAIQSKGYLQTEKEVRGSNEQKHLSSNNHERLVNNNQRPRADQVLDSTKRRTRHHESPIVIMKPAKLVRKSVILAAKDLSSKASIQQDNVAIDSINKENAIIPKHAQMSSRLQHLAKDGNGGSGKSWGSISPRVQQKKIELEKRSRPPTPPDSSKSRRQSNKQQSESNSPGGGRRSKHSNVLQSGDKLSEVNIESRHHENENPVQSNEGVLKDGLVDSSERSPAARSCQSLPMKASKIMSSDLIDKKSTRALSEEESGEFDFVPPEYSSPISVLDKVVCKDDSPSPVKYAEKTLKADVYMDKEMDSSEVQRSSVYNFLSDSTESGPISEISRKKLRNIEDLVQKLRRLNSTHNEARTDYIASLCENTNPDHRYISEILLASGLLLRELGSNLTNFQFHPSGHPINPELFLVLEQTKASTLLEEECSHSEMTTRAITEGKLHRKLIFDTVNEILARKLASGCPFSEHWLRPVKVSKRAMNAQKLLREMCSEIELLQAENLKCGSDEEDDGWKNILYEDVMHKSESWIYFDDQISGALLDIERSIFKDLVNEIVIGESNGLKTKPGKRRLFAK